MREKERIIRILDLLKTYWEKHQDQRFGQMLINLGLVDDSMRLWSNDDGSTEEHLKQMIKEE